MRHPHRTRRAWVLLHAALLALTTAGCTSTRVTRVARFEPAGGAGAVHRPAPKSAAYKVKYASARGDGLHTVGGTKRIVGRGELLGFATSPDGKIVAVAGDEQLPLDNLPPGARYCVWTFKEKRPTQFSRELSKATATAASAAVVGVAVVGAASLGLLNATEEEEEEDDAAEEGDAGEQVRREGPRRPRGYRWVGADGKPPGGAPSGKGKR